MDFRYIAPLLQSGASRSSRIFSYAGLGTGVVLLLCSLQMYLNIQQLLRGRSESSSGYDFVSISKTITNATMGSPEKNLFNAAEIEEMRSRPYIQGAAPVLANNFRVQLSGGEVIPLSTDFILESLDNEFIDTVPASFSWEENQNTIPIIFSSDFLEMYNVFAPGYGLPQISPETASQLVVFITCYGADGSRQTYRGNIVALSDRINSILVPKSFLDWANKKYSGSTMPVKASRVYLKTTDANDPALLGFLDSKGYKVNKDKVKFGRVKQVLQGVFGGLGVFGLLVVLLALMLFSFYLQLMVARSKDNLQLLITLGYSPSWLSKKVSGKFIPVYVMIVLCALVITQLVQFAFKQFMRSGNPSLSPWIHWSIALTALLLVLVSVFANYSLVQKLLRGIAGNEK
jgi:hypothetical protein